MAKRLYPHDRIRYWYVYDINDICALFKDKGLHPQTVRKWIKQYGLKILDHKKPTLIYGYDLIQFIKKHNQKGKCQTEFHQFFCLSCKDARSVYRGTIQMTHKANGLHVKARCRTCKKDMYKTYTMSDYQKLKKKFHVVDVLELYDCTNATSMTQFHKPEKNNGNESYYGDLFA